jgi:pyruvate/2-oxoglutarate/acetoin dehydrogenase E1 component
LKVVVPSTPADEGGLLLSALEDNGPVIYLEHKLLANYWLDYLGAGGRKTVSYDIPEGGARGSVPAKWEPVPIGKAVIRREGTDITLCGAGVSVHRAQAAAEELGDEGISTEVIDLRTITPLDIATVEQSVRKTGHLIVVDEDYKEFGLSGEIAAQLLEKGATFRYDRVCTEQTIPYNRQDEETVLPGKERITSAAKLLLGIKK